MTATDSNRNVFTISQLNRRARQLLETHFSLVWVRGEISNLARPGSGHWYFTLKDKDAQIRCAMFRNRNSLVAKPPKEGDQVLVRGRISLYENRGDYQLIAEHMEPDGIGVLQQQFELLKNKLSAEGLFDQQHKQLLPEYPRRIGVITSPTGAAIRDILHVLERRSPWIPVMLYPTAVQGKPAAAEIAEAIACANMANCCDVLIVGRGGGSLEDLWPFNEEVVARAVYQSEIPIISAVGHETDFTISDFVADLRAPTPSAAAEIVSPDLQTLTGNLIYYRETLEKLTQRLIQQHRRQLDHLRKRLRNPAERLRQQAQHLDHLEVRLTKAMAGLIHNRHNRLQHLKTQLASRSPARHIDKASTMLQTLSHRLALAMDSQLHRDREKLAGLASTLHAVSPLATLERGYAIPKNSSGEIIRSVAKVEIGDAVGLQIRDGNLQLTVSDKSPNSN